MLKIIQSSLFLSISLIHQKKKNYSQCGAVSLSVYFGHFQPVCISQFRSFTGFFCREEKNKQQPLCC